MQPIEQMEDELAQAWSPVSHLNSVANSDELREAYNACLPLLSEYGTWSGQHSGLYEAYQQIADSAGLRVTGRARQKAIENALRDFRLAGVALPAEQEAAICASLRKRLSELGSKFSDNVLDATNAWRKQVSEEQLARTARHRPGQRPPGGAAGGPGRLPDHPGVSVLLPGTDLLR